jgi:hypothetical protein
MDSRTHDLDDDPLEQQLERSARLAKLWSELLELRAEVRRAEALHDQHGMHGRSYAVH